jgi:leucyl-tRNA synthetase
MDYRPTEIEPKWQKFWQTSKVFEAKDLDSRPKYYILDMFPYPSGSGLHVGHGVGYTVTDVIARYKRMLGFNVLHPMGWDSFGLPAEQYAIRTGTHPGITTDKNIANIKSQLQQFGYSYDWSREIKTSDPSYYKWTQWIFGLLYKKGLAYQASELVNYCPDLGTVLSNEEVENGKSVEGGFPVVRVPLKQWILKITAYAERLLEDLNLLDWPENLKKQQENWIGKSEGALIHFEAENGQQIPIFTTCPHTLMGVTFIVLAPEHPLLLSLISQSQKETVEAYLEHVKTKSDLQRTDLNKDKSGVFLGSYVLHPVTGKKIPLWTADYVLANYATGAVMGVPSHDERDFDFAAFHHLELKPVIAPREATQEQLEEIQEKGWFAPGVMIHSKEADFNLDGMSIEEAIHACTTWLVEHGKGERKISYKLRDWLFSRQRYWGEPIPILHYEDGSMRLLEVNELALTPPTLEDYRPSGDGQSPLAKVSSWIQGVDSKTGKAFWRETNTMPQWAGSCWYYLRFIDPKNDQEAWQLDKEKYWMPVDTYVGGAEHAVLHLLYARFWHKVLYDCGYVSTLEPFQQLRNQGVIVAKSYKLKTGGYVSPAEVECVEGEWIHVPTGKPVMEQVEKMSKSKLNGVSPDEVIAEHGTDALRLYTLFMGPFDKEKLWDNRAINGCSRFLRRVHALFFSPKKSQERNQEAFILTHQLIAQVTQEIEAWQFNVAIAKMMEFLNQFEKLALYPIECLKDLVLLISPFAPHLAEELWQTLGYTQSLAFESFPKANPQWLELAKASLVTVVVQINGKVRARLEMEAGSDQKKVLELALKEEHIARHMNQKEPSKVIFVPDKLLNIVVAG